VCVGVYVDPSLYKLALLSRCIMLLIKMPIASVRGKKSIINCNLQRLELDLDLELDLSLGSDLGIDSYLDLKRC
jgi:hypothetical protein